MNRAAIDIGSNSLLLTVVDPSGAVLHDEATVVGLAKGLGDGGAFRPDRMERAREVLEAYVRRAAALGVPAAEIRAVATSGARRAVNAGAFFDAVEAQLGLHARTISGEDEAALSYRGALRGLSVAWPVLVVDLGGGSTELVLGQGAAITRRHSMELGSARLTERFGQDPRAIAAFVLPRVPPGFQASEAVFVAGTATTLAAMALGLERYDGEQVHGSILSRAALVAMAERLAAASPAERRRLAAVSPERAEFLVAGATVLSCVLEAVGLEQARISDGGLRFGLLAD